MRTILHSQDFWTYVIDGYVEPIDAATELTMYNADHVLLKENRKKDKKALGLIQQGLNESIFMNISSVASSKMAWDILETCYQGVSKVKTVKLQNLRRDFENLKMKDNESVDTFMTQLMSVVNQLRQYGDDFEKKRVVEKVLRSLPKKFEPVFVPIEEFKDLSLIKIDELTSSLIAHESRISRYEEVSMEHAFKSQLHATRGKGRFYNHGRGGRIFGRRDNKTESKSEEKSQQNPPNLRGSSNKPWQQENQRYDKTKVQCYYCKKFGHFANKCWKKQEDVGKQSAHITNESEDHQNPVFLTCNVTQESANDILFLDSGCSNHMTSNKDLFSSIDTSIQSEVKLGNDCKVTVNGKGVVPIYTKNNHRRNIDDVYFVPGLKCNLISVGQLMEKKY
jgi:hypothetical protein